MNTFKSHFSLIALALLCCIGFKANSQTAGNTFGVSESQWSTYIKKTNQLMEKVEVDGFINFVILASKGDLAEKVYFKDYVRAKMHADKDLIAYKVGTGVLKSSGEINTYLASLQPKYKSYFDEYKKNRVEIIETHKSMRGPSGGTPTPSACGSPCSNPGFESGTGVWDYQSGTACSAADPCGLVPGFLASAHALQTAGGFDPMVPTLPVVAPGGGTSSMMIGDGPTIGGYASRVSLSFTVDSTSTNFTYRYAVVLQDPVSGHTDPERPYFRAKLRDALGNILPCGDYEVIAKPPIVGFFLAPGTSDVYYRPWTNVFVPLDAYIGQCVTLEFTSSDCAQTGHFGYAYIDADCNPSGLVTSSAAVCAGATITLAGPVGAASYDWSNVATGDSTGIVGPDTTQTIQVNAGGTYQVILTSFVGAGCTSTLTITVPSSPNNPFAAYSTDSVCAGLPTTFTNLSTPVDSLDGYAWDFDNDGVTDDTTANPTHVFPVGGTYPVTLIISWGPCNVSLSQSVFVWPGGIPNITPVGPLCSNVVPFNLTTSLSGGTWAGTGITNPTAGTFDPSAASTSSPNVITYTIVSGPCIYADTISIDVIPSSFPTWTTTTLCATDPAINLNSLITGTSGGTWSGTGVSGSTFNPAGLSGSIAVTYTVGTSPCVGVLTQNITVISSSSATITSGATLCTTGSPITLTAASPGGTWSGSTGINPTTGVFTPATAGAGVYIITYSIGGPCPVSDTVHVTVIQGGVPAWTLPPDICETAASINLSLLVTGTPGGTWSGPGVTGNTFDPTGLSGNVTITYSVGQPGCVSTSSLTIDVDYVDADFTATPTTGLAPLTVDFLNTSSNAVAYFWDLGNGDSTFVANPTSVYDEFGNYTIVLVATSASGCTDTAMLTIFVDELSALTFPNVFTPNGDANNEIFQAIIAENIVSFEATIYDRWGLKMYEWNNANAGWNGDAKNGKPAPDGTYYYIIKATGINAKDYLYSGFVQLIREK